MSIRSQNNDADAAYYIGTQVKKDLSNSANLLQRIQEEEEKLANHTGDTQAIQKDLHTAAEELVQVGKQGVADVAKASDPSPGGGSYIPMSMAAGIILAFLAMIKYGNEINSLQSQLAISWAKSLMGTQADGTIDYTKGVAGEWYSNQVAAGQKQAEGLQAQAIGYLVGAAMGVASVAAMGVGYAKNCTETFSEENRVAADKVQDAQTRQSALSGSPESVLKAGDLDAVRDADGAVRDGAVQTQMDRMRDGVDQNFRAKNADGTINEDQARINNQAAALLKGEDRTEAIKSANKRVESAQAQRSNGQQAQNTWSQAVTAANNAVGAGGTAYGTWENATDTAEAAAAKAAADVYQQNTTQMEGAKDKANDQAQKNHEAANQEAEALGQALSSIKG